MRREWITFFCGVIVFFMPFLGFPRLFNQAVYMLVGLLLVVMSLRNLRRKYVTDLYQKADTSVRE